MRADERLLRSSDWDVWTIPTHGEAMALVRAWHYSSSGPNTSTYRHGLYRNAVLTTLHGAAIWLPPTRPAGEAVAGDDWRGVLSLSRLVVDPEVPKNGASFLLGRSMRLIDRDRWPVLVTYADTNQGHTGAIYKATNWTEHGPVPAGDVWEMPDGSLCGRKRGGKNLTVADLRAMGARKRPNAPKIRFVHDVRKAAA